MKTQASTEQSRPLQRRFEHKVVFSIVCFGLLLLFSGMSASAESKPHKIVLLGAPDLTTLSANFPLNSPWSENEKGLQPLPDMRGIPVQIIASSFHDFGTSSHAPVFTVGLFHRALVAAGVDATILEMDTSPHRIEQPVAEAVVRFLSSFHSGR